MAASLDTPALRERLADIPTLIRRYFPSVELEEEALKLLCHYGWPGNVRQLISTAEGLAANAGGRIITTDRVRREVDFGRKSAPAPCDTGRSPALREGETLIDYVFRGVVAVYERERSHLGSHSVTAHRLGMNRTTLYDWLEWARRHVTK